MSSATHDRPRAHVYLAMGSYRSIRAPGFEALHGRGMPRRDFLRGLVAAGAGSVLAAALGPGAARLRRPATRRAGARRSVPGRRDRGRSARRRLGDLDARRGARRPRARRGGVDGRRGRLVRDGRRGRPRDGRPRDRLVREGARARPAPRSFLPVPLHGLRDSTRATAGCAPRRVRAPRRIGSATRSRAASSRAPTASTARESLYVTHRAIAADEPDFLLHLGDYVYVSDGGTITLDELPRASTNASARTRCCRICRPPCRWSRCGTTASSTTASTAPARPIASPRRAGPGSK